MAEVLQKHLKALDEMCSRISFALKEKEVLSQILKRSCEILDVEGMSILIGSANAEKLLFFAVEGVSKEEVMNIKEIPVKEGIAGWVFNTGKSVFLNDPYSHPKFLPMVDKKTGYKTRNLICVPLISRMKKMGVIEIVNKKNGNFESNDLYFSQALAGIISIVIRNMSLFNELAKQKNLVKNILANIPGGFIAIDRKRGIIEFNKAAGVILGFGGEIIKQSINDVLKMQPEVINALEKTIREEKTGNRLVMNTQRRNGEKLILGYGTILIKSEDGKVMGSGIIFQDLTKIQGLP